jgi:LIVCS family branched-chain amino acid:cation transporter
MQEKISKSTIWSTGLAIFAMFFGAGNIVFPLAIGQLTQDKNVYALLGLILTAVFVPLIGLLAMMLYNGNYSAFFRQIGKVPGFIVTLVILGVIGPFGGIPRCITISHSTLSQFGLPLNLPLFSLLSCVVIFLVTFRPTKMLSLLGYVLTPILLLSLGLIAIKGLFLDKMTEVSTFTRWETFSQGLLTGYNTMDLLAAFFFSSVVLVCLKGKKEEDENQKNSLVKTAVFGSLIAAVLLGVVYVSFSCLAARQGAALQDLPNHELLGALAYKLLGPYAGLAAGVAVAFACLTTEIALAAVLGGFIRKTLCKEKIRYELAILITLALSFAVSTLHFEGISSLLSPFLEVCYPALIVLTLVSILHKMYNFQWIKLFFYSTLLISLFSYVLSE